MKSKVLAWLKETDGYLSGQELCDRLQVSRTAVWKVIHQLKEEGYEIEAVSRKGYRLLVCPDIITKEEIKTLTQTVWAGNEIVVYEETDSTNTRAKRLAEEAGSHGTLVVAERQTDGKGRRGRTWETLDGRNIYMSLLLKPKLLPEKISPVTLVAALAAQQAVSRITGMQSQVKWPNDLVINGKKICGILTEMSSQVDFINYVVIGIGINVNATFFEGELSDKAESISHLSGARVRRSELIAEFLNAFEPLYDCFEKEGSIEFMKEAYQQVLVNKDRHVTVLGAESSFDGIARGIDSAGELLVEKEDGTMVTVLSGEVSVRGVYGYAE